MISTHILDTSLGVPAQNVTVQLELKVGDNWNLLGAEQTNSDGRIIFNCPAIAGVYRLQFQTENYFKQAKLNSFFTTIPVIFHISDIGRKYHVPLLLNPYGYSTYRGS